MNPIPFADYDALLDAMYERPRDLREGAPERGWETQYRRIRADIANRMNPLPAMGGERLGMGCALRSLGPGAWLLEEAGMIRPLRASWIGLERAHGAFWRALDPSAPLSVPGDGLQPENAGRESVRHAATKVREHGFERLADAMAGIHIRRGILVYLGPVPVQV